MGSMVPISLLAYMMETRVVSGRMRLFQLLGMHQPKLVHRQVGDLKALLFQLLAGVQHGVVLDLRW